MATRASNRGVRARGSGGKGKGRGKGSAPSRMPEQLMNSYAYGKVAARIAWGTPGAGRRCHAQATAHRVPSRMRWGMCQNVAKRAGTRIGVGSRR